MSWFSRRSFVWRYCIVASFFIYFISFGAFISLISSSSTPKSSNDDSFPEIQTALTVAVRNQSPTSSRPQVAGFAGAPAPLNKTLMKKPSVLDDLHKNMTLHKANMSDLLQHVKAVVAKRTNGSADGKVANPHPFKYILNTPDICRDQDIYIIAYIHTAPDHYKRRMVIRQTWGDATYYDINIRVVFVMGRTTTFNITTSVQRAVEFEAAQYNDIVQEDFLDTYRNLTYKGIAALKWITERCAHARYVLKTDDDIFVNTFILLRHLRRLDKQAATSNSGSPRGILLCLVWYNMMVMRQGKWKVSKEEWPQDSYPTYCSGSAFLMTTDVAIAMYYISFEVRFFWVDDFYITGLLPLKLGKDVVQHKQFMGSYLLNGRLLEEKFTGPQWFQYIFSHVHNLNTIQAVWKTVVKLSRGEIIPTIPFALPGHLPKVVDSQPKKKS